MTIPLPPLPPPQEVEILLNGTVRGVVQGYSEKQVRAIQREAVRVLLQANVLSPNGPETLHQWRQVRGTAAREVVEGYATPFAFSTVLRVVSPG